MMMTTMMMKASIRTVARTATTISQVVLSASFV